MEEEEDEDQLNPKVINNVEVADEGKYKQQQADTTQQKIVSGKFYSINVIFT